MKYRNKHQAQQIMYSSGILVHILYAVLYSGSISRTRGRELYLCAHALMRCSWLMLS